MIGYFDASFVVGLVMQDPHWRTLSRVVGSDVQPILSDFSRGECVAAIGTRVRRAHGAAGDLHHLLDQLERLTGRWTAIPITPADVRRATELVRRFDLALRLPDAIHLAIAERLGATLYTGDLRQHRAALALGLPSINPLAPRDQP